MSENTIAVPPVPNPKAQLTRKALIVIGATAGLLIAGGFALGKKTEEDNCGCEVSSETDD